MKRLGVVAVAALLAALAAGGSSAAPRVGANVFTGYGFDTCTAPSVAALQAWQASPYRAVGVYIGGANRACPDGNLSASWVGTVTSLGWSLMPIYVGLQAPCATQKGLQKISAAQAEAQGVAAADDAVQRAALFGLPAGSPITFDMEGYSTKNPTCSQTVETFLAGWVSELHAQGFVPSVYGSAASTIRDTATLSPPPDAIWIADWNGVASVFGDPYVSDSLWPNHQRVRQYKGGHKETWGGVTLNIDNDYVDGPVVGAAASPPPPPPPTPPAGSVGSGDNQASAAWPEGAFTTSAVVTLTPTTPTTPPAGWSSAGYAVTLAVDDASAKPPTPITTFEKAVDVHFVPRSAPGIPVVSTDGGATWQPVPQLSSATLPAGQTTGYTINPDGSIDIQTLEAGIFALVADQTPPGKPVVAARFLHGALRLSWHPVSDNSGRIGAYRILLDGTPLKTVSGTARLATTKAFHPGTTTVYRVQAVDAAGNAGKPSQPVVVVPSPKPAKLPKPVPQWAWKLFSFQHEHSGVRPKTPRPFPGWYWTWAAWRLEPFRVKAR